MSTSCQHRVKFMTAPVSAIPKSYKIMLTSCQDPIKFMWTPCQHHAIVMWSHAAIVSSSCQHHVNTMPKWCRQHAKIVSSSCQHHFNAMLKFKGLALPADPFKSQVLMSCRDCSPVRVHSRIRDVTRCHASVKSYVLSVQSYVQSEDRQTAY